MKRYILIASAVLVSGVCRPALAQDLDPTVVVSRAYEGQLADASKPSFDMMVPDSVSRFDLDFDYTVFEKPYKGSYEFSPYLLTMQPSSAARNPKQLYFRAGAGYTLHPVLDLVWTPAFKGAFKMDVYASHRSYFGSYRGFEAPDVQDAVLNIDRWEGGDGSHTYWKGYDCLTRGGVDVLYDWDKGVVRFDAAYLGIASKDQRKKRHLDALEVMAGMCSKNDADSSFVYDVQVDYLCGVDAMNSLGQDLSIGEHVFGVTAEVGSVINRMHHVLFDVGLDLASSSYPTLSSTVGHFSIVPHYVLKRNRWSVDAGLRVAMLLNPDKTQEFYPASGQVVYPDVKAWFDVLPGAMRVYAGIGGGSRLDTYTSSVESNHHFDHTFGCGMWPLVDAVVERISASLGFKGRISSFFGYDLRAGYVNYKNARLDAVTVGLGTDGAGLQYLPGSGYAGYQKFYASLDWNLKTENVSFDGSMTYTLPWGVKDANLFLPSPFRGDVAFEYNWNRRIYVGTDCEYAFARTGRVVNVANGGTVQDAKVPGYADLGLYVEVAANGFMSFWLRGGNLLNMTVQRNLLYAERGINFTAGICLNL